MLRVYMPDEGAWWSASINGLRLPPQVIARAKAMGMERGATDFTFLLRDGLTRYLDLKTPTGTLSDEQKKVRALVGADAFAICTVWPMDNRRTWEGVKTVLAGWMTPLGLRLLTDAESVKREYGSRAA